MRNSQKFQLKKKVAGINCHEDVKIKMSVNTQYINKEGDGNVQKGCHTLNRGIFIFYKKMRENVF